MFKLVSNNLIGLDGTSWPNVYMVIFSRQDISAGSYKVHVTRCWRYTTFCEVCEMPVASDEWESHIEECHIPKQSVTPGEAEQCQVCAAFEPAVWAGCSYNLEKEDSVGEYNYTESVHYITVSYAACLITSFSA